MRKSIYLIVISILILSAFCLLPVAVSAQNTDQITVIDDAGIFGSGIGEVETAVNECQNRGAAVRIRTITTYGTAGSLDRYEIQLEQQNPSWTDGNGNIKGNLIVLIIALQERMVGLYYGSDWDSILNNQWENIQMNIMVPLFKEGDYTGGTIKGLAEIQRLISGTSPTAITTLTPTTTVTQQAKGSTPAWIVPLVILLVLGVLVGITLFFYYRITRARRLAARQKAMLSKQAAASGINELIEKTRMLEIKINVMTDKITPQEVTPLKIGLEKAGHLVDQGSLAYSELSHSAGDPENPKLGEVELTAIEPEYQKILANLREAREAVEQVEDQIDIYQQAVDSFPDRVTELNDAIRSAEERQGDLKNTGFKTDYIAGLIDRSREILEQAKELAAKQRITEAIKKAYSASEQTKQAVYAIEELPQKKQEVEKAIPLLSARIEQVEGTINKARDVFERVSADYAETTWEPVRGNGTEAENRVNWTLEALEDARTAAKSENQEWHQALELLEKGNTWLTEAASLVKSISELEPNLIAARRAAPDEINAAQVDIAKAWSYINTYDEDIRESLEDDLHQAEKKNELAIEELQQGKPDYFKVCKLAREANEAADKILVQARSEHEAAERLRLKAAGARRDASAKVAITRKFVEDHHPVIQDEARSYMNTAITSLQQAEAAADLNSQISLAEKAESAADRAYSLAQHDVRETSRSIPVIIIPPIGGRSGDRYTTNPWSGGSGSRGGGGSMTWGSSRGGMRGGGSSSWSSGGGHRGGGSKGW